MLDLDNIRIGGKSGVDQAGEAIELDKVEWEEGKFEHRHIGISREDEQKMLQQMGYDSLEELIDKAIPPSIRYHNSLNLPAAKSELEALKSLKAIASQNKVFRNYIGMGYYDCFTPPVIQRNILENPNWYTAYTPYQPEISQGRLEALLNFQTMVMDLTGMEIANASLLDEGTAAAEAMNLCRHVAKIDSNVLLVDENCHPQTIEVIKTRARYLNINVVVADVVGFDLETTPPFACLVQYPGSDGTIVDYQELVERVHAKGGLVIFATDLLALTLLKPPGELNADVVVGNSQRFGVPLGYGGPHAAFFATRQEYKRLLPGRLVGVSVDATGKPALRLALQTREQHIRRDRATSNICTAQVLLAVVAATYAIYHGEKGLKRIATRVHNLTKLLALQLQKLGYQLKSHSFFDTITLLLSDEEKIEAIRNSADSRAINFRYYPRGIGISLDETTTIEDVNTIVEIFALHKPRRGGETIPLEQLGIPTKLQRTSRFLTAKVFNQYHTETELLRYLHRLESRDLSLTTSMIPLGSCTMKLNATSEMLPISWPEFNKIHPFAPLSQTQGYQTMFAQLESWLAEITGMKGVSLQPNAGSQGEYAGLQVIRQYHQSRGGGHRDVCLIPESAHGTNPASAVMCGLRVVNVACDKRGNIDIEDLRQKAEKYQQHLAAIMVTYPSTHGVFEEGIREICDIVHHYGGQVYLDGANMNALVGLCRPGDFGADVCHLNLHKTFCIPHGGGGPGVGPICVASHLVPFLPATGFGRKGEENSIGWIASAPWGSASILPISWMYIAMMGAEGLTRATKIAILNANYIAHRLAPYYPILYTGKEGLVAHECIIDLRPFKKTADVTVEDVAKRLMDYGFHAPTMSWPVAGTLMIEPTESESLAELERFCEAMISIRQEIAAIERGEMDKKDNPLKNAPHTAESLVQPWNHPYSREVAVYPAPHLREYKFWPPVARIDNAYGDRNLVCSCLG